MISLDEFVNVVYKILEILILLISFGVVAKSIITGTFFKVLLRIHSDHKHQISWMRVCCSFVILSTIVFAFHQYNVNQKTEEGLIIGLIGLALGGKTVQKFAENKAPITEESIKADAAAAEEAKKMI